MCPLCRVFFLWFVFGVAAQSVWATGPIGKPPRVAGTHRSLHARLHAVPKLDLDDPRLRTFSAFTDAIRGLGSSAEVAANATVTYTTTSFSGTGIIVSSDPDGSGLVMTNHHVHRFGSEPARAYWPGGYWEVGETILEAPSLDFAVARIHGGKQTAPLRFDTEWFSGQRVYSISMGIYFGLFIERLRQQGRNPDHFIKDGCRSEPDAGKFARSA
jgi:hypothetical protein